ncbi:MAG: PKD domain-containing protein, partial [Candidatus Hydrogenedentes bacterium]|nr:PKD domain-containing protein [Candidatus Hydrogenedentota bacterium]
MIKRTKALCSVVLLGLVLVFGTGCPSTGSDVVEVSIDATPRIGYADLNVQFHGVTTAMSPYIVVDDKFRFEGQIPGGGGAGTGAPTTLTVSDFTIVVLSWEWDFGDGTTGTGPNPTHVYTKPGKYTVIVTVNFSDGTSITETYVEYIEVLAPNNPPIADAGTDVQLASATNVQLDGTRSEDPDGDILSYHWIIISRPPGSTVELDDPNVARPMFTPDVIGTYVFELFVDDGSEDSQPDRVEVEVLCIPNDSPVADAGPDQSVALGATVQLDGSGSFDPNNDPLTFAWRYIGTPRGATMPVLDDPTSEMPSFTPSVPGQYEFELIVDDGKGHTTCPGADAKVASLPDAVLITVLGPGNTPPIADAGPDQDVDIPLGETTVDVTLDGSGSTDSDGTVVAYEWTGTPDPDDIDGP